MSSFSKSLCLLTLLAITLCPCATSFCARLDGSSPKAARPLTNNNYHGHRTIYLSNPSRKLFTSNDDEASFVMSPSDQGALGIAGSAAALVALYSEYTLANTGCGLPAGPVGLVGLVEGLSYLGVVLIAGFSLFTKLRTGSGLPSGPAGLLGAAEGLSYLVVLNGVVVLFLQLTNYGYIPNAVPMEGGMCK